MRDKAKYNAYMRDYMLRRYYKRRNQALIDFGGKCQDCGSTENLEFDHIDARTKKYEVAKIWNYSDGRFQEELKKCQLLCKDCHLIKSRLEGDVGVAKHGTLSVRNCYCPPCRKAKTEYAREWKHKKNAALA